jgi:hypothetical protein
MDLDKLTRRVVSGSTEYTIVRPGITLCLLYAKPAITLASVVADILEMYISFIPAHYKPIYRRAEHGKRLPRTYSTRP